MTTVRVPHFRLSEREDERKVWQHYYAVWCTTHTYLELRCLQALFGMYRAFCCWVIKNADCTHHLAFRICATTIRNVILLITLKLTANLTLQTVEALNGAMPLSGHADQSLLYHNMLLHTISGTCTFAVSGIMHSITRLLCHCAEVDCSAE